MTFAYLRFFHQMPFAVTVAVSLQQQLLPMSLMLFSLMIVAYANNLLLGCMHLVVVQLSAFK